MDDSPSTEDVKPQDSRGEWALPVNRLNVDGVSEDAVNINVEGRHVNNVMQGFGQMWQKTYRIRFDGVQVPPREVIRVWKEEFSRFWPEGNYFYRGETGPLKAGEVAVLNLAGPGGINAPGGKPMISTGILVIYADDESFSFLTPEGHMFSGMNTFSSYEEDGVTYAQIQALIRASDPLYEVMLRLGIGHKMEDDFWSETLKNLATHFGASGVPTLTRVNVDSRVQWSEATNIWHNAGIRTTMHTLATPLRWVGRKLRGK